MSETERGISEADRPITARLVSLEFLGSALFTAFIVGGTWFSYTGRVEAQDKVIEEVKATQAVQAEDLQQIKTNIAVILERQKAADARAHRQERATQNILDTVRQMARDSRAN